MILRLATRQEGSLDTGCAIDPATEWNGHIAGRNHGTLEAKDEEEEERIMHVHLQQSEKQFGPQN